MGSGAGAEAGRSHAAGVMGAAEEKLTCKGALAWGVEYKNLGAKSGIQNPFAEHSGANNF